MEERSKNTYHTRLYAFVKNILVECPGCAGQALVHTGGFETLKFKSHEIKVTCSHCGYNKTLENITHRQDPKQKQGLVKIFGAPIDPFFHLPLWYKTDFGDEVLWAYNLEHLNFLAEHVGAKLRERNSNPGTGNGIAARLPRWMTAATNREAVLKAIEKLVLK